MEKHKTVVSDFLQFLNKSCTAYHAVNSAKDLLLAVGFIHLDETESWSLIKGTSYFFIRSGTTIIAFTVGGNYASGNGFTIIGAHTDSPCLKIKPNPCSKKADALVLNTQPYGGGLWHTWFDRDLGLAGRVIVRSNSNEENKNTTFESKLIRIDTPVARIPNLAIHLTSGSERDHFAPNLQEHAKAIITMDPTLVDLKLPDPTTLSLISPVSRFHPFLLQLIAHQLQVPVENIADIELQLIDIQPSVFGGGMNGTSEFVLSGRLDNLCSAYQSLRALIDSSVVNQGSGENIAMVMLFDHEEIGSNSCAGAGSSLFMDTLRLINQALTDGSHGTLMRSLRKSLVVSADMAHGFHPNYPSKHDPDHAPKINGGLVIKHNANQRYATNAVSATLLRELAGKVGEKVQEFAVKSDSGCGSTIGPIIATLSGIATVDVGSPQFSMHSIREMMGAQDVVTGYKIFQSVYLNHATVAATMKAV